MRGRGDGRLPAVVAPDDDDNDDDDSSNELEEILPRRGGRNASHFRLSSNSSQ